MKNLLILFFLLLPVIAFSKKNVPFMLANVEIESSLLNDSDKKQLSETLTNSAQSGIFNSQRQMKGIVFSLIDEDAQKQALKEQSSQRKKECLDNECLVDTGKMLAAQKIAKFLVKETSKNNWRISGKIVDVESGAIENVEIGYCKECGLKTLEMFEIKMSETSEKLLISLYEENYQGKTDDRDVKTEEVKSTYTSNYNLDQLQKNKDEALKKLDKLDFDDDDDNKKITVKETSSDAKIIFNDAIDYYAGHDKKIVNQKTAFELMKKSYEKGYIPATGWMCIMFNKGYGTEKDSYTAKKYCDEAVSKGLEKEAEKGDVNAVVTIGIFYDNGYGGITPDFERAYNFYKKANHSIALNNLADMYYYGNHVSANTTQAVEYFQKAAEMGNVLSQSWLGYIFKTESNFINYTLSTNWFLKAAAQGDAYSLRNLAEAYYYGTGVTADTKKAFDFFVKAGDLNDKIAQSWVGYMYQYGYGVSKNITSAREWYQKAINQDDTYSMHNMGLTYYEEGKYKESVKWFEKANETNYVASQVKLGEIYYNGYGVNADTYKAFEYFLKAGNGGNKTAQSWIGYMYHYGYGTRKNIESARDWYQKAADQNDAYSMHNIGLTYYEEQAYATSFSWFKKAAELNYIDSFVKLGEIYFNGYGTTADYYKAFDYYLKGAQGNNKTAMEWVGYCYQFGYGVTLNKREAIVWYQKAVALGSTYAQDRLKELK